MSRALLAFALSVLTLLATGCSTGEGWAIDESRPTGGLVGVSSTSDRLIVRLASPSLQADVARIQQHLTASNSFATGLAFDRWSRCLIIKTFNRSGNQLVVYDPDRADLWAIDLPAAAQRADLTAADGGVALLLKTFDQDAGTKRRSALDLEPLRATRVNNIPPATHAAEVGAVSTIPTVAATNADLLDSTIDQTDIQNPVARIRTTRGEITIALPNSPDAPIRDPRGLHTVRPSIRTHVPGWNSNTILLIQPDGTEANLGLAQIPRPVWIP